MAVCTQPSPLQRLVVMFCVFWPLLALGFLRTRGRSSEPLTSMLLPLAIASCGTWVGLIRMLHGAAISGGGVNSMMAGSAEAVRTLVLGAVSSGAVALAALLRRHRPVADRGALILTTLTIANAVAALVFPPALPGATLGAIIALALALAAGVWLFVTARSIVVPQLLPRYTLIVFASIAIVGVLAWERVELLSRIAIYGIGFLQ